MTKINMTTICRDTAKKHKIEMKGWGFSLMADTELDALRIAYTYRRSPHGVKVEHCPNVSQFMVTVWNASAKEMGCDV